MEMRHEYGSMAAFVYQWVNETLSQRTGEDKHLMQDISKLTVSCRQESWLPLECKALELLELDNTGWDEEIR
jgi:hypothetical protein